MTNLVLHSSLPTTAGSEEQTSPFLGRGRAGIGESGSDSATSAVQRVIILWILHEFESGWARTIRRLRDTHRRDGLDVKDLVDDQLGAVHLRRRVEVNLRVGCVDDHVRQGRAVENLKLAYLLRAVEQEIRQDNAVFCAKTDLRVDRRSWRVPWGDGVVGADELRPRAEEHAFEVIGAFRHGDDDRIFDLQGAIAAGGQWPARGHGDRRRDVDARSPDGRRGPRGHRAGETRAAGPRPPWASCRLMVASAPFAACFRLRSRVAAEATLPSWFPPRIRRRPPWSAGFT